jgi:hypothetical protein
VPFSLVSGEQEVEEMVEKLTGDILRLSFDELWQDMVDLMEMKSFFLHDLSGGENNRGRGSQCV